VKPGAGSAYLVGEGRAIASEPEDDEALLAAARAGEREAFRMIFVRHSPAVRRYLGGLMRAPDEADDAAQETFARAHASLGSIREGARLRPWLLGIAKNIWLDALSRRRLRSRPLPIEPAPEPQAPDDGILHGEAERVLGAALARLEPERRAALLMRLDQDLGYGEIADAMGWSLQKVKNEIHRSRLQIREEILGYLRGAP